MSTLCRGRLDRGAQRSTTQGVSRTIKEYQGVDQPWPLRSFSDQISLSRPHVLRALRRPAVPTRQEFLQLLQPCPLVQCTPLDGNLLPDIDLTSFHKIQNIKQDMIQHDTKPKNKTKQRQCPVKGWHKEHKAQCVVFNWARWTSCTYCFHQDSHRTVELRSPFVSEIRLSMSALAAHDCARKPGRVWSASFVCSSWDMMSMSVSQASCGQFNTVARLK